MKSLLIAFLAIFSLTVVPQVFAQNCTETDLGCIPKDPAQFVTTLYGAGLGMIGGLSLLFIMIGGYYIMTSRGDIDQVRKGKSYVYYALSGLALSIAGFTLYQVIAKDILKIPGFS